MVQMFRKFTIRSLPRMMPHSTANLQTEAGTKHFQGHCAYSTCMHHMQHLNVSMETQRWSARDKRETSPGNSVGAWKNELHSLVFNGFTHKWWLRYPTGEMQRLLVFYLENHCAHLWVEGSPCVALDLHPFLPLSPQRRDPSHTTHHLPSRSHCSVLRAKRSRDVK